MYSVGAPHTWPQVLGSLVWLIDTVKVRSRDYGDDVVGWPTCVLLIRFWVQTLDFCSMYCLEDKVYHFCVSDLLVYEQGRASVQRLRRGQHGRRQHEHRGGGRV